MTYGAETVLQAETLLRPGAGDLASAWHAIVTAEREQVERLPNRPRPEDFYAPVAQAFRADPYRQDDQLLQRLRSLVGPDETWLDVGAGGGRYTLPLALLARRVYAVEPSAGMRETLAAEAREHGIDNLDVYAERWPAPRSEAPVADVAFMSQVGYDIAEIGPFLDQFEAHAQRLCVVVMFDQAPITYFAPLWQPVHGERRIELPALPQLVALLYARGRSPCIEGMTLPVRAFADLAALQAAGRRPLWLLPDTPEDARLGAALRALARPVADGVTLEERGRFLGIVTWEPRANN